MTEIWGHSLFPASFILAGAVGGWAAAGTSVLASTTQEPIDNNGRGRGAAPWPVFDSRYISSVPYTIVVEPLAARENETALKLSIVQPSVLGGRGAQWAARLHRRTTACRARVLANQWAIPGRGPKRTPFVPLSHAITADWSLSPITPLCCVPAWRRTVQLATLNGPSGRHCDCCQLSSP
jgi:hypothetical protein